ncbi:ABC transporter permease [Kibdelosporangium persicum]|uniref:ABC-2 type transport system permease protein n=1 Tax=Kibdelosporangium persicum TaxID=2698649 RepID=A0ABX2FFN6_9PSEU|nr:ABC transporter permease [Kibdelosporangium persicum]NRN69707.1 ABC-2 type transport system permease protein [Kibdelosporangium persicum]
MVVHLALTELRLLFRKKLTLASVLLVPAVLCVTAWLQLRDLPASEWPVQLGFTYVMLLTLSVFLVATTVFTARRQSLVLKRLRTSELSDNGVFAGIAGPILVVGLAQSVIYFGVSMAVGAPVPSQVAVVLVGLVLGLPSALLAGIVTAAFSRSVEVTQVTAIPVLLVAMAGMFMLRSPDDMVATIGSALPLAGPGELIAEGWAGSVPIVSLVATIGWLLVMGFVAHRFFKWEPRQ